MSKRKSKFGNMTTDNTGKVNATRTNTYEQAIKDVLTDIKGSRNRCPDVDVDKVLTDLYNQREVEMTKGQDGARKFHLKG